MRAICGKERTMKAADSVGGRAVVLILFSIAAMHALFPGRLMLDWPTVVLVCASLFLAIAPKLDRYLPLLKSLKIGQTEIELQAKAEEVAESVEKSEAKAIESPSNAPKTGGDEQRSAAQRLLDTSRESQIIKLSSTDRIAAILMLAIDIEREVLFLAGTLGLRNRAKTGSLRECVQLLQEQKVITPEIASALMEFAQLRNQIVHATIRFTAEDPALISALDSGLRLLRLLKRVPRPIYTVKRAKVPLFRDPEKKEQIAGVFGVILEVITQDGMVEERIFPAGRDFTEGEIVGWDWDMTRSYGKAYYWDETLKRVRSGWDSSAAFAGKREEPAGV